MIRLISIVLGFALIIGCSNEPRTSSSFITTIENNESNYFENLKVTNVTFKKNSDGWIRAIGEIKNDNNVTINGYIQIVLYDSEGSILDSSLISLPIGGLKPNETGVFSETITKESFKSYKFFDSTLISR